MSNKPAVQIDNSLVKQEEDITRSLNKNQNENLNEDELDHIDKIFKKIKSYGRYQLFFFITYQIMSISAAMSMISGFFKLGNLIPDYTCDDEDNSWTLNATVIKKNSTAACEMITNCSSITTTNYWYSMYEEYNWVCSSSDHLLATFQSLLSIGYFSGNMIGAHLSDHFGRKWMLICGEVYNIISGIACALIPSFTAYSIFIIIGSVIGSVSESAAISLIVESVNPKYRLIQGFSFQYMLGLMMAGGLASLVRNWRTHLLISKLIGIPAVLMMLKLEESPRFFLQKRRFKEAAEALTRIAKFNKIKDAEFTPQQMEKIYVNEQKAKQKSLESLKSLKKYTAKDLFSNWKMTSYAIPQILTGITINIVLTVPYYNIQDLSGNPFMNIFLMGALRIWVPITAIFLENGTQIIDRKTLLVIFQVLVSCCFSSMMFIDIFKLSDSIKSVGTMIVIIGYVIEFGFVWITYKLYTSELFPTCMRSIALSTFSCTSHIGIVISPQLVYLSKFWNPAPYVGAAVAALLSAIFSAIFLPKTQFIALPDTVHQAKNRKILYKETGSPTPMINNNRKFTATLSIDPDEPEDEKIMLEPLEE